MSDHPSPADRAKARQFAADLASGRIVHVLESELRRLQAVERAAAELVAASDESAVQDMGLDQMHNLERLLTNLTALLTAAGPHQTGPENSNGETL